MLKVYTLRDSAANSFLALSLHRTDQMAIRALGVLVNQDDNNVSRHPSDYELFRVADFDDTDGTILGYSPVSVVRCVDLVVKKEKSDAS